MKVRTIFCFSHPLSVHYNTNSNTLIANTSPVAKTQMQTISIMNSNTTPFTFVSVPQPRWTYAAVPVQFCASEASRATFNFDGSAFREHVLSTSLRTSDTFDELVKGSVSCFLTFTSLFILISTTVYHLHHIKRSLHPGNIRDRWDSYTRGPQACGVQACCRNHPESRSQESSPPL